MTASLSSTALAWLLTYAIHSTALLSLAWLVVRIRRWPAAATELLWKSALVGGILTATVQLQLDVRPAGTFSLRRTDGPPTASSAVPTPAAPKRARVEATEASSPAPATTDAPPPARRPSNEALILGLWATIALVLASSYAARRLILVGRLGDRTPVSDGRLLDTLHELSRDAGLRAPPRLTATTRISSPIALGVREICVPESALTELDLEQQRSMLAHELAHLARRDPVWMGLASLVERVLWIQPLNRVARRQIARSAEFICDDWAVRRTGSGIALARCLAQVAEWVQASPLGVPVAGMAEERSLLVSRVARLLEGGTPAARSRRGLAFAAAIVLGATIVVAPGVSSTSARTLRADEPGMPRADESRAKEPPSADSSVVIALIARLKDEDAEVRKAAAHSLGRLGDARAVPGLIGALKDPEPKVRSAAAEALGEFEDARAIPALSALLADTSTEVKQSALDALSHFDEGVSSAGVVRLLSDNDAEIRHRAAHLAGKLHDRTASPALARLVHDSNSDVRQAALEALGELKDLSAVPAILSALSDANADVRHQALNTLEELHAPIPDATLIGLMKDGNPDVRGKAAELAGERSVIAAIPALKRLLDDGNADVRGNAISALGNIADSGANEALRGALTSKDAKVRRAAAEALGERRQ
jgi:HEAT repeat protein/beta-lactamase regulating signal transducer with metallopeptidase domain